MNTTDKLLALIAQQYTKPKKESPVTKALNRLQGKYQVDEYDIPAELIWTSSNAASANGRWLVNVQTNVAYHRNQLQ